MQLILNGILSHKDSLKVVVFMTGSLGDTLATVPTLWSIRERWPRARLTILSDAQIGRSLVSPRTILEGAGLIDEFLHYPVTSGKATVGNRLRSAFALWLVLRRARPDLLVYLIRVFDGDARIRRDRAFFRLAGIRSIIGMSHSPKKPETTLAKGLSSLPRLADLHLQQIAEDGISVPSEGKGRIDLALNTGDHSQVAAWLAKLPQDGGRRWIAFGVGSKMPAKIWRPERYEQLGQLLIDKYDIWPAIFGGAEDLPLAMRLVARWRRGYVAAGILGIRASAAALSRCCLYVGNDTGTMHLAAAAGVPCVAIFSARDFRGLWEPYGTEHQILRRDVSCAGCGLEVCPLPGHPCLENIGMNEVFLACSRAVEKKSA